MSMNSISSNLFVNKCNNELEPVNDNDQIELPKDCVYTYLNGLLNETDAHSGIYSSKNVLLIGTGSIKRLPILLNLKSFKFNRLVGVVKSKNWAFKHFNDVILAEHENIESKTETLFKIKNYMQNNCVKFDAVLTYDDYCTHLTSFIAESLNLPGIPFSLATNIVNKYEFRRLCQRLGIHTPIFFMLKANERQVHLSNLKEADLIGNSTCAFPVVVKNSTGCGKGLIPIYFIR